jgi:hypothetical protein
MIKSEMEDSIREDKYVKDGDEDLPDWVTQSGVKDGYMISVGIAEGNADQSPTYLKRAAMMDAQGQLFIRAPHEYREAVQSAVEGSNLNFNMVQTRMLKLSGVTNVSFPAKMSFCQKAVRDTGSYVQLKRICYQQALVPLQDMNHAIEQTLAKYYPKDKSAEFQSLLATELKKIYGNDIKPSDKLNLQANIDNDVEGKK